MEEKAILTDANNLEVHDLIDEIMDDITEGEKPFDSCHCAIKASADPYKTQSGELEEVRVLTHALLPGDVILKKEAQTEEDECHCDYWWTVSRPVTVGVHPLPIGTRVCHQGQQWHRSHMGGTATVVGVYGPLRDGTFEYRVMAGVEFSRQTDGDNPEERLTDWSSSAVYGPFLN